MFTEYLDLAGRFLIVSLILLMIFWFLYKLQALFYLIIGIIGVIITGLIIIGVYKVYVFKCELKKDMTMTCPSLKTQKRRTKTQKKRKT